MISHAFESKRFQKIVCFGSTHKVKIPQGFPTHKDGKQKSAQRSGFGSFILVHWLLRNFTLGELVLGTKDRI